VARTEVVCGRKAGGDSDGGRVIGGWLIIVDVLRQRKKRGRK